MQSIKRQTDFDYLQDRDVELLELFDKEMKSLGFYSLNEAVKRMADSPAQRFYVNPHQATFIIRRMLKGKNVRIKRAEKRKMYEELLRRVKNIMERDKKISISHAVKKVVEEPAPSFYVSKNSIRILICNAKRRIKDEKNEQRRR